MAKTYTLVGRPWWVSHAVSTNLGIVVARCDAVSTLIREPTADDLASGVACNEYDYGPDCHGDFVRIMVDLTEQDLEDMHLSPGRLAWPVVVDGPRPRTNRSDAPVSRSRAMRAIDMLQSEGHCDDIDPIDKTPWHKGDNYAE